MSARAAALAAAFACVGFASSARADDAPTPAPIGNDMRGYYAGELSSAYVVGGIGVGALGGGSALATRDGEFARGLGWSLIAIGAIDVVGAVFYTFQVHSQIDHYESLLDTDPSAYKRVEYDHMSSTTSRFVGYRLGELGLMLTGAGVAGYGFAANRDAWKGAGIGVAAMALPVLIIDTINQARAARYRDSVHDFRPSVAIEPGVSGRPWSFAIGGRF